MNAWAFVIIALGILIITIGWKRTQGNVLTALTGKGSFASADATARSSPGNMAI